MKNLVKAVQLSQSALKTTVTRVLYAVKRDANDLCKYGVTTQMIADFETKVNNLYATGPDSDWRALLSIKVSDLEAARNGLVKDIRAIGFTLKLNGNSPELTYAQMQIKNMASLDKVELERAVSTLIETFDTNHDLVIAAGVTDERITELKTAYNVFVNKMAEKLDAHQIRKANTESRTNDYINVYDLALKYAEIGKEHWKNLSPAKYRDYVLLQSSADKASPPVANTQIVADKPVVKDVTTPVVTPTETPATVVGTVVTETKAG